MNSENTLDSLGYSEYSEYWTIKDYESGSWDKKLFKREVVFNLERKTSSF